MSPREVVIVIRADFKAAGVTGAAVLVLMCADVFPIADI